MQITIIGNCIRSFFYGCCVFISCVVQADTIELKNGDRISGDITDLNGKSLKIKTSYAGTVTLDTDAIRTLQTTSAQGWQINLKSQHVLVNESDSSGYVLINGKTVPISELMLTPASSDWKKSGLLEASLDVDNDQQRKEKLHVNAELNLESKHWRHKVKTESKRDKERNRVTEDTAELKYTLDYLFSNHWFMRADTTYREEGVNTVSHYWYVGGGPGYRVWGEDKDKLDLTIAYNRLWLASGPLDWELGAWALALDYKQFWLDEKFETFFDIHASMPTIDAIDYIANSSSGLRYYLKHNVHVSLKYDYNETRFILGTVKDSSYVLGAGVNF